MGTVKQRLKRLFPALKSDIKRNQRLLLAAVILFCLNWALFSPTKGIEQIILYQLNKDRYLTLGSDLEQIPLSPLSANALGGNYLISDNNILAGITQTEALAQTNQNSTDQLILSPKLALVQENALLSQNTPITFISQKPRSEIITYTVQEGDTLSTIAASFGITTNTLLWANKLKATSLIRPGDELIILPVSGVLHRVKNGQTINWIAKYYKAEADKIIAFNDLPADGSIQIGQKLIIPDGQMPTPSSPRVATRIASRRYTGAGTGKSHSFPYGQCTWYVAQKRYVPWSGHAKYWLANARAMGFQTGNAPRPGAIIVTRENGWYGHVAYVEAVNGSWVTISEMNYLGWGVKSVRTLNVRNPVIRGYIY